MRGHSSSPYTTSALSTSLLMVFRPADHFRGLLNWKFCGRSSAALLTNSVVCSYCSFHIWRDPITPSVIIFFIVPFYIIIIISLSNFIIYNKPIWQVDSHPILFGFPVRYGYYLYFLIFIFIFGFSVSSRSLVWLLTNPLASNKSPCFWPDCAFTHFYRGFHGTHYRTSFSGDFHQYFSLPHLC